MQRITFVSEGNVPPIYPNVFMFARIIREEVSISCINQISVLSRPGSTGVLSTLKRNQKHPQLKR